MDSNREVILWAFIRQVVEHGLHHRRRKFLGRQSITPPHNRWLRSTLALTFKNCIHYVQIKRFACRSWFLGAIEYSDFLDGGRQCGQELAYTERPEKTYL